MRLFQAVEADPKGVGGDVQRPCAVGRDRDAQEIFFCVKDKIVKTVSAVAPQQGFAAFENNDPGAESFQRLQRRDGLIPGHVIFFVIGAQMKRTGPAGEVTAVRNLEAGQKRRRAPQNFALKEKFGKVHRPREAVRLSLLFVIHWHDRCFLFETIGIKEKRVNTITLNDARD